MTIRSFSSFLLGRRDFCTAGEILQVVSSHHAFKAAEEDLNTAEALLIFQTSKQQTWLAATRKRLYCVLDDRNKDFTRVQWTLSATELVSNRSVVARIHSRSHSDSAGLLDINDRRNWLFSKGLFTTQSIQSIVRALIERAMLANAT